MRQKAQLGAEPRREDEKRQRSRVAIPDSAEIPRDGDKREEQLHFTLSATR